MFESDGGCQFQEVLPKGLQAKPKRVVPYRKYEFHTDDGGMMYEDRRGVVPHNVQPAPTRPVSYLQNAFSSDGGMMFEAKTYPGQIVRADTPAPQTSAMSYKPSVFSSDSGDDVCSKDITRPDCQS